tara:strand:- start:276 stop:1796 length:1521 start_codon:yes stop_codon:yes gene_type:complete
MVGNKLIEMGGAGRTLMTVIGRMNPVLLGVSAVAAAVGGAYLLLKEDTEGAAEAAEELARRQLSVNLAMAKGESALFSARSSLAELSGAFGASEIAMFKSAETAQGAYAQSIATMTEEIDKATAAQNAAEQVIIDRGITMDDDKMAFLAAKAVVTRLRQERQLLIDQEKELAAVLTETAEKKAKIAADADAESDAEKARAEARRARLKKEADALKDLATSTDTAGSSLKSLEKIEAALITARVKGIAAVDLWEETQLAAIDALSKGYKEGSDIFIQAENARTEVREAAAAKRIKVTDDEAAAAAALADANIEADRKMVESALRRDEERLNYAGDFVNATGALMENLSERLGASAEDQAMTAYLVSQTAALSQIAISTIVAAAKAAEQTGILAAVSVPAMYALGAVQAAAVLATPAPKFHSGGMIAPDERMITAQTGEAVLSRSGVAAAGGASGVNDLNRGGGGGAIVVVNQYRHRVFDSFIMDNLRRTGSPLALAISATGSKAGIL